MLLSLVVAARACERDQGNNPFAARYTEHAYWKLFKHIEDRQGVRLRVVIDIISGTSAGGIDGIVLAEALAGNLSQEPLREGDDHSDIAVGDPNGDPTQKRGD